MVGAGAIGFRRQLPEEGVAHSAHAYWALTPPQPLCPSYTRDFRSSARQRHREILPQAPQQVGRRMSSEEREGDATSEELVPAFPSAATAEEEGPTCHLTSNSSHRCHQGSRGAMDSIPQLGALCCSPRECKRVCTVH